MKYRSKNIVQAIQDWQIILEQTGQILSWQKEICVPRVEAESLMVINTAEKWAYYMKVSAEMGRRLTRKQILVGDPMGKRQEVKR